MKSILTLLFLKIHLSRRFTDDDAQNANNSDKKSQTTKNAIENEFEQASFNLFDSEAMTSEIEEQIKILIYQT